MAAAVGVKPHYQPWEVNLVRKLNLCSLLGTFNVLIALILFPAIGYYDSVPECLVVLALTPLVFWLNVRVGYVAAIYLFTFIGCFLFFVVSARLGLATFCFLYYFPLIIGLVHMLDRRELFLHLGAALGLCVLSFFGMLFVADAGFLRADLALSVVQVLRYVNICFSFFTCIGFMIIVSTESIAQERQLKNTLHQKELLLAELFHRVKNNLAIVNSLLNLKKNNSSNPETQVTLEECRSLIYSMSLVHTRIYDNGSFHSLNLRHYLSELLPELVNSIGGRENIDYSLHSPDIQLGLNQAIPCSLIVNELITNAFKYARLPDRKLKIDVVLRHEKGSVCLELRDNGPGRKEEDMGRNSMGMDLIHSLAEQLEGEYCFANNSGLQFRLRFKH